MLVGQVLAVQNRLVEEYVDHGRDVRLYHKEEELLGRDGEEPRADNGIRRIRPDTMVYEIRVPGQRCRKGDNDEGQRLVQVQPRKKGPQPKRQETSQRNCVFDMPTPSMLVFFFWFCHDHRTR